MSYREVDLGTTYSHHQFLQLLLEYYLRPYRLVVFTDESSSICFILDLITLISDVVALLLYLGLKNLSTGQQECYQWPLESALSGHLPPGDVNLT